jgi:hypothetical protein
MRHIVRIFALQSAADYGLQAQLRRAAIANFRQKSGHEAVRNYLHLPHISNDFPHARAH